MSAQVALTPGGIGEVISQKCVQAVLEGTPWRIAGFLDRDEEFDTRFRFSGCSIPVRHN